MELYIIRHGQSHNNALKDARDRVCDPPLTDIGRRQAVLLAEYLKRRTDSSETSGAWFYQNRHGYDFTRLYCSPMLRALETAEPIGRAIGLAPHIWVDLHEHWGIFLDHGDGRGPVGYPGITREEIVARFPDYVIPECITSRGWWNRPPEVEAEWTARAARVVSRLWDRFGETDERIALITHGGCINSLLCRLLHDIPPGTAAFSHQNTAISRVDWADTHHPNGDGHIVLQYLNRVEHLPIELMT